MLIESTHLSVRQAAADASLGLGDVENVRQRLIVDVTTDQWTSSY